MNALAGPFYPTSDLVAVAWLGQRVPGIVAGQVATTLPGDVLTWAAEGFVQAQVVTGSADIDLAAVRHPVLQLDFWAATADAAGNVSAKPAWNKANRLAELVRVATEDQAHGQAVTLPAGYQGARVQAFYFLTEPTRMNGDPSGYARFTVDAQMDWVRA